MSDIVYRCFWKDSEDQWVDVIPAEQPSCTTRMNTSGLWCNETMRAPKFIRQAAGYHPGLVNVYKLIKTWRQLESDDDDDGVVVWFIRYRFSHQELNA